MPFDQAHTPDTGSWDAFFESLPFVTDAEAQGRRRFWKDTQTAILDLTEATSNGQHTGLERGAAWADQTGAALAKSYRRGVLLRILRDMEFESAEAVGFIGQLEEALVSAASSEDTSSSSASAGSSAEAA